nr:putative reverse transcriptase domain-containing protein [Tanacetum cinerariifolium]
MVNMRVSYQVDVRSRESSDFYSRHHDAQKDRAAVSAKIEVLRRERLAYEQESIQTHEALARSEAYSRALEARVAVLENQACRHEWQRLTADDLVVQHIMRTQALEAGAHIDTLENTARAYAVGNSDRNIYTGDCRSRPANANNNNTNNNNRNNNNNQKGNDCYECKAQGHFKRNCPKLKNNNRGNQGGNDNAQARVYVVGNAGGNPDNVVVGTFLLNNRYAYILFNMGVDRSFVSTTFSSQIDIAPIALDHHYNVEIANGRIIGLNTIMRDCTLNFLNHPFNIDLLPVELG